MLRAAWAPGVEIFCPRLGLVSHSAQAHSQTSATKGSDLASRADRFDRVTDLYGGRRGRRARRRSDRALATAQGPSAVAGVERLFLGFVAFALLGE